MWRKYFPYLCIKLLIISERGTIPSICVISLFETSQVCYSLRHVISLPVMELKCLRMRIHISLPHGKIYRIHFYHILFRIKFPLLLTYFNSNKTTNRFFIDFYICNLLILCVSVLDFSVCEEVSYFWRQTYSVHDKVVVKSVKLFFMQMQYHIADGYDRKHRCLKCLCRKLL